MTPDHRLKLESMAIWARAKGVPVQVTWTFESMHDTIQDHARKAAMLLMREVEAKPGFKCHLWAHSMGGLVARYMLNHVTISRPWDEVVTSVTTFATPHNGTPISNSALVAKIWTASGQMSDEGVKIWNDPAHSDTYSPAPANIPFYHWKSYLKSQWGADDLAGFLGYRAIAKDLIEQGRDPSNDSVVPFASQAFGQYLGNVREQHQFFSLPSKGATDFYKQHWAWLKSRHAELKTGT